jgi:hypothetical protein
MNGWNARNTAKKSERGFVNAILFAANKLIYNHKIANGLLRNLQFCGLH